MFYRVKIWSGDLKQVIYPLTLRRRLGMLRWTVIMLWGALLLSLFIAVGYSVYSETCLVTKDKERVQVVR